jgi:hypothetical protein
MQPSATDGRSWHIIRTGRSGPFQTRPTSKVWASTAYKRLDRLKDLVLDKQRTRDRACGYDFAEIVETRFRIESLFRSPNHLEIPLTMTLAEHLFSRLGMDPAIVTASAANPPPGLFPISAPPIHPRVAEKFGLTFAEADTRYRYFDDGGFTFEEYCV